VGTPDSDIDGIIVIRGAPPLGHMAIDVASERRWKLGKEPRVRLLHTTPATNFCR
jgi:hypothetical protein